MMCRHRRLLDVLPTQARDQLLLQTASRCRGVTGGTAVTVEAVAQVPAQVPAVAIATMTVP